MCKRAIRFRHPKADCYIFQCLSWTDSIKPSLLFSLYRFQVIFCTIQLAKCVGNINSYQIVSDITLIRSLDQEKIWNFWKQIFARSCQFVRTSDIFFVYSMLKFMTNNTLQWCLHLKLQKTRCCQNTGWPGIYWLKKSSYTWNIVRFHGYYRLK